MREAIRANGGTARAAAVAVALGICACATMIQPPRAAATVTRLGVFPDINYGPLTNYGTGCGYTVEAVLSTGIGPVALYDNGIRFATVEPTDGVALTTWVPATRGPHTLGAAQSPDDRITATVTVPVGVGMPIGTSCLVI